MATQIDQSSSDASGLPNGAIISSIGSPFPYFDNDAINLADFDRDDGQSNRGSGGAAGGTGGKGQAGESGSQMSNTFEGGCRCGRVRYKAMLDQLPRVYACHCLDCQTWSGSAFSLQFILGEDQLEVSGEPGLFELTSPDGTRTSRQRACPVCFTRVYNTNTRRPGMAVVRAGTLDDTSWLRPTVHLWTRSKQPWITLPDGDQSFVTQPADLGGFWASAGSQPATGG